MSLQCLLGILLLSCRTSCLGEVIPECEVKEKLEYKLDSPVTFKALARPNTTFQAEVSCKNDFLLRHLLTFDSHSTKLSRNNHQGIPSSNTLPSPGFVEGWTEFTLGVGDNGYAFVDAKGHSWIPKDVSSECQADKVILSKGQLVDNCGDGAPTWQVLGEKCVEIPLPKTDAGCAANLALYSDTSFTPSFLVGGTELVLGWKDGSLKLVSDATMPLPPQRRYCLSFSRSSDGNIKLQEGHSQQIVSLASAVQKISACGRLLGSFKLQQSSEKCGGIPRISDGGKSLLVTGIGIAAVGAVVVKFICYWYFLKCRRKNRTTKEEKRTKAISKEDNTPVYLEPIPCTNPTASLTTSNSHSSLASSSNISDHIYEEIDEVAVYVNCPGTCGSEPHLVDEYESRDSEISDE